MVIALWPYPRRKFGLVNPCGSGGSEGEPRFCSLKLACGVQYVQSCQLVVKRLSSEILLSFLMFGQIQPKRKIGLTWGAVLCSKGLPHFGIFRSLLELLCFFSEKQLAP